MKKNLLLIFSLILVTSCSTTNQLNIKPTDTLTLALQKVTTGLIGSIKIESIRGYISSRNYNKLKSCTEKYLLEEKNLVLIENTYSTYTDYSLFISSSSTSYGYNVNIKIIENYSNKIIKSETIFLSDGYFNSASHTNHNPYFEIILIAIASGFIFLANI